MHSSHTPPSPAEDFETGVPGSGWANAHTPKGHKALSYRDLRYQGKQTDLREAEREIVVRLGGNMERYIWTLNGKKFPDARPIQLQYGERVRLTFVNDTMMAHPMHLHGMFMQLENGQPMEKLPNKHTLIVAPGDTYSVLLTADEAGEWAFHCHLLYHMMSGMMNKVVVAKLDAAKEPHHAH
jgi:FtsP/CotA-like multicopper oxidase with cupredoxin domain